MTDNVARAVGAGQMVEVNGKEYMIRPISMRHLKEVQAEALKYFKRQFIQTYVDNADLLGENANKFVMEKLNEASRWDLNDLPARYVNDTSNLKITPKLQKWLADRFGDLPESNDMKLAMVSAVLDSGELTKDEIKALTGSVPPRVKVPYDAWWITATYEGMSTLVWAGLGGLNSEVSKEEVQSWPLIKLYEAVQVVQTITAPAVGNM